MNRLSRRLFDFLKHPARIAAVGFVAVPLFAGTFSWSIVPVGPVVPVNYGIEIDAVFTNPEPTNLNIEVLSWQFDLGTFSPYYALAPGLINDIDITALASSTSPPYKVAVLLPVSFPHALVGSSLELGPSSVTYCDPGISCFDSPVTVEETGHFGVTLGAAVLPTPEAATWVMVSIGSFWLFAVPRRKQYLHVPDGNGRHVPSEAVPSADIPD
jgi:hypothetical protein